MNLNLSIRQVPELELLVPSVDVVCFNQELIDLSKEMLRVMEVDDGVGLAAPQIGYNLKLIVLGNSIRHFSPTAFSNAALSDNDKTLGYVLVNPKIVVTCNEKVDLWKGEACLSLMQAMSGGVERYSCIKIAYQNVHGQKFTEIIMGKLSTIVQHEMDHLYGILYPARMKLSERTKLFADYVRKKKLNINTVLHFNDFMMQNLQALDEQKIKNNFGTQDMIESAKSIGVDKIDNMLDHINFVNKGAKC